MSVKRTALELLLAVAVWRKEIAPALELRFNEQDKAANREARRCAARAVKFAGSVAQRCEGLRP